MGTDALTVSPPAPRAPSTFTNSEAAFQALKFWNNAGEFRSLTGDQAFQKKKQYTGKEDFQYGGYGGNWQGMLAVLREKFKVASMKKGLIDTGDHFLVEHNSVPNRDLVWSDNCDGSGTNWLGLQLMVIRDELTKKSSWTKFIHSQVDAASGKPLRGTTLPELVLEASQALQLAINANAALPPPSSSGALSEDWGLNTAATAALSGAAGLLLVLRIL